MRRFRFVCVFWGDAFGELLTSYCLPSLLAADNIPAWPALAVSEWVFYTTKDVEQKFSAHPAIQLLNKYLPIRWVEVTWPSDIDETIEGAKYLIKSRFNQESLQAAHQEHCQWIQIIPDSVYPNGVLQHLSALITQGYEVITYIGPRVADTCLARLRDYVQGHCLTLSVEKATQIMFEHLHPEYKNCFWFAPTFVPTSVFYWEQGLLHQATYTPEPIYLKCPRSLALPYEGTLDGGYLQAYEDLIPHRMCVIGGDAFPVFSLAPVDADGIIPMSFLPFENRPTLSYLHSIYCFYSKFHDWAFGKTVSWSNLTPSPEDQTWQSQQTLLDTRPWEAPRILREMIWLLHQGQYQNLLEFWGRPAVKKILIAITDSRLRFWADVVAQAYYKQGDWPSFIHFVTHYRACLLEAPRYLPQHCPFYAAYLPWPLTLALYPHGWPGTEHLAPFHLVWLETTEAQIRINMEGQCVWICDNQLFTEQGWLLDLNAQPPDLLPDLIYRCLGLCLSKSLAPQVGQMILLAVLYGKPVVWLPH